MHGEGWAIVACLIIEKVSGCVSMFPGVWCEPVEVNIVHDCDLFDPVMNSWLVTV